MSSPRHLWSGDWQLDSATAAEELARRRAQSPEPEEPTPELPPRPSLRARIVAALRAFWAQMRAFWARLRAVGKGRRLRTALAVVVVLLLGAGVAFGVTSLIESGGNGTQTASLGHGWLGVTHMENAPAGGVVITSIAPGSPAASAGLEPGDVITQVGNQPVQSVGDVNSALNGLVAGNTVQIQFDRGPATFSTLATLAVQPHGGP
jgi:membrane-associated protease RseP (regulator of RpoE activity)